MRYNLIKLSFFTICVLMYQTMWSQQAGSPNIINFSKTDFQGGSQTMEIQQLSNGYICAANNHGLLIYDGTSWQCFRQPNQTIMRSIEVVGDRIYCGGQNELGYFTFETGTAKYNSLLHLLPPALSNIGDVWQIQLVNKKLIFRTSEQLFSLENEKLIILAEKGEFKSSFFFNDSFYYQKDNFVFDLASGKPFIELNVDAIVKGCIISNADTVIVTEKSGLLKLETMAATVPFNGSLNSLLLDAGVNSFYNIENGFAFCTARGGIILSDQNLEITGAYTIEEGLQRNDVLCLFSDHHGDLWAGTSNGIDYITQSSPFRFIHPDGRLLGAGYATALFNGKLYFGTNNGVYEAYYNHLANQDFRLLNGTVGQVWGLKNVSNMLWIAHHEGLFYYDGSSLRNVAGLSGVWDVQEIPGHSDHLLVGHYNGISLIALENEDWRLKKSFEQPAQSARIFARENNNTWWMSHPYVGSWRFSINTSNWEMESIKFYGVNEGFPSNLHIHVANIANEMMFTAENGLFAYDKKSDRIVELPDFNNLFTGSQRFLRLYDSPNNDVWFITEKEAGIIAVEESALVKSANKHTISPLKSKLVGGFELISFIDNESIIVGAEDGFIHINYPQLERVYLEGPQLSIRKVEVIHKSDSTIFDALATTDSSFTVSYDQRSLRFGFTNTSFHIAKDIDYQFKLEKFDIDWVNWDKSFSKEYTNLRAGDYTFNVRAVSADGTELSRSSIQFTVLPPWYMTTTAIVGGVLLFIFLITLFVWAPKRKYEREKLAIVTMKEKEFDEHKAQSDYVIDKLKNEKLEVEIGHKNKELASATMHLVQKGQILQSIRDSLQEFDPSSGDKAKKELRRLVRMINDDIKLDNNWEQFELHFDQVHVDFLKRLRAAYPKLTPNDHKLCAYLRMNLSTKEIATILNISVRGVEISRYRLRKKLDLDTNENLTEFITNL